MRLPGYISDMYILPKIFRSNKDIGLKPRRQDFTRRPLAINGALPSSNKKSSTSYRRSSPHNRSSHEIDCCKKKTQSEHQNNLQSGVMKKVLIACALSLATFSTQAQPYVEIGYGGALYEADGVEASTGIMRGVFGYDITDNLAIEGILGFGARSGNIETKEYSFIDLEMKTKHVFGLYVTPKMKFSDSLEGFARIGTSRVTARFDTPYGSDQEKESGFSFGLGARYNINERVFLGTDYMSYYRKSGTKAHGLNLNIGFRF